MRKTAVLMFFGSGMVSRKQYYITGEDASSDFQGSYWKAQTFTVVTPHTITKLRMKVYRNGNPGWATVSIRGTSSGLPFGADLSVGSFDGDILGMDSGGTWVEFDVGHIALSAAKYAICARAPGGSGGNVVYWREDGSSPTYAGGSRCNSTGGLSWTEWPASDFMFEEWGYE